jgi:hypothetical protein
MRRHDLGFPAERIRAMVVGEKLAAPHAVDLDCASTLRGLVRGKKLPADEGERASVARQDEPGADGHAPLLPRIWQSRHNIDGAEGLARSDLAELNRSLRRNINSARGYQPPIELTARRVAAARPGMA